MIHDIPDREYKSRVAEILEDGDFLEDFLSDLRNSPHPENDWNDTLLDAVHCRIEADLEQAREESRRGREEDCA